ncbi:hypothetical protein HUU05_23585, partial [candidate division KSB1 bacterium]|nr:hypothetical protein [candidate division KSB1 bacterium]
MPMLGVKQAPGLFAGSIPGEDGFAILCSFELSLNSISFAQELAAYHDQSPAGLHCRPQLRPKTRLSSPCQLQQLIGGGLQQHGLNTALQGAFDLQESFNLGNLIRLEINRRKA